MKELTLMKKVFLLKKIFFFKDLDFDMLLTISNKMESISFKSNQHIFYCDQKAFKMYFIVHGEVDIVDKGGNLLAHLNN